jgi:hypothetical protein
VAEARVTAGRRALGAAAVVVLLALAGLLGVLSLDVLRWRDQLSESELRLAAAPSVRGLEPDTRLPRGVSGRLLGIRDDLDFREAVQLFRLARPGQPARELRDVALRSRAETALARVGRSGATAAQRSRAALLRGIFAFEEARGNEAQRAVFLRRSLVEFREAIRLDARNEDAKYDLELALRLLQNAESDSGGGAGGQRGDTPAAGAGAASSGSGF